MRYSESAPGCYLVQAVVSNADDPDVVEDQELRHRLRIASTGFTIGLTDCVGSGLELF